MTSNKQTISAAAAGTISIGGDLTVNRLGFGAIRITGPGIWGEPLGRDEAIRTLRRLPELGVDFGIPVTLHSTPKAVDGMTELH